MEVIAAKGMNRGRHFTNGEKAAHIGEYVASVRKSKRVSVRFARKGVHGWEITRVPEPTNLNHGFVPMQAFTHLNSNPIKEFQREGCMVLKVSPILRVPVPI